jgi:ATP-binding cassette subfamily B protein
MDPAVRSPELRRGGRRMIVAATKRAGWWIPIGLGASLLWVAAKLLIPLAARSAIDEGFTPYDSSVILKWCLVILGLGCLAALGAGFRWYCAFYVGHRTEHVLRSQLFAHLQQLHFGYHDRAQIGNLMARANLDLRQINQLVLFVPVFAANMVMVVAILAVLFALNVKLTLLSLVSFPLLAIGAAWFQKLLDPVAARLQERLAQVSEVVEEGVAGIRVVKGFGAEQVENARLDERAEQVRREAVALGSLRATFNPLLDLLPMVALVTVLYVGGKDAIDGTLTVGDLVAFAALLLQLVFPLRMTSYVVAQVARASASAARVQEVMVTEPEIVDDESLPPIPSGPGAVAFSAVRFAYHGGHDVLRDFDLEIAGGESVALVGPTGCGKSTVARLIPRFYDAVDGSVTIDGHDVRTVQLGSLRREIGLVFEDTFLFSDTVWENLAFSAGGGDRDADHHAIERAARLAGADEFIQELPDGYDTLLGEHGFSLSGGQRQRLAIARAILADPRVLILDDATSAVDPTKEHEIRAALTEVMRGRTTLIIAHRPATIALADRVVLMDDDGRIAAMGTHAELLATDERYRRVLADISDEHETVR